jgi:hypothetical protein
MQIICKDGTTIPCEDFEAVDSGVLFYQESRPQQQASEEEEEEDEEEPEMRASGFVPLPELQFVVPDSMVRQQAPGAQQQRRTGQMPPGGQGQHPEGMAQQQQMYQSPSGTGPQSGP